MIDRVRSNDLKFLVCVHNVATDMPYVIMNVSHSSSSQDIIAQVAALSYKTFPKQTLHVYTFNRRERLHRAEI